MAELHGAVRRHARWREPTQAETAAAVAELREILAGRDDGPGLLAGVADVRLGFYEGEPDEPKAKAAGGLCRQQRADETLIPQWIEEGRRRREQTQLNRPPSSAPQRRPPGPGPGTLRGSRRAACS